MPATPPSTDPTHPNRSALRRLTQFVAALLLVPLLLTGLTRPAAAQGVKYRDRVFTDVDVTKDIPYIQELGSDWIYEQDLDIYQPHGDVDALRPAMVYMHGGGGDKADALSAMIATIMAQHGLVVVSINYSYNTPGSHEAGADVRTAIAWVNAHAAAYRIDPTRVAISGASAGAMAATDAAYLPDHAAGEPAQDERARAVVSISGTGPEIGPEAGEPPVLMLHGELDDVVPLRRAQGFCDAANAAGVPCTMRTYRAGHVIIAFAEDIEVQITEFLWNALDAEHLPATNPPATDAPTTAPPATDPPADPTTTAPTSTVPPAPRTTVDPPIVVTPRFAG